MTVKLPRNIPPKSDVYYSPKYDDCLFIFDTDKKAFFDELCYYKPMSITDAKEDFLRRCHADRLTEELIPRWHEHFFDVLNSSFRKSRQRKNSYRLTSRLLTADYGGATYYIAKPRSTELMLYIADGKPQIAFLFGDIGFTDLQFQGNAYYLPTYNLYIFGEQEYTGYCEKYSSDCWDSADELIKIPIFASPQSILKECGLSAEKKIDREYMDYCLDDEIYYDNFWNQYGIRTIEEQQLIYGCICKYKVMEYNWLTKRGARLMLTDQDKKDLGLIYNCKK